jgi:sugar fermentation stimulation protein A
MTPDASPQVHDGRNTVAHSGRSRRRKPGSRPLDFGFRRNDGNRTKRVPVLRKCSTKYLVDSCMAREIDLTRIPSSLPTALTWPDLVCGTLIKRYKRFMADVELTSGETVTAHCPNSGSMKGCSEPGRAVYLSKSDNPKRRLIYTWEMIDMQTSLVGVNTSIPNRLVAHSIMLSRVAPLAGYDKLLREVRCGTSSRIDLLLERYDGDRCFIEVKSCTLVEKRVAYFPDAVTARGRKHLVELQHRIREGDRSVIFFLVQRMDAQLFKPADHMDAKYGEELRKAIAAGVEILVYDVDIDTTGIALRNRLSWEL